MADEEQLRILEQGVEVWNKWREDNPDIEIDLEGAELGGINLIGTNPIEANLFGADIIGADIIGANLNRADLNRAYLIRANLREANLREANLFGAYLLGVDLEGANLFGADLCMAQAVGANFSGAILTEACIEDWNINSQTEFNNVICNYVYLKEGLQKRIPHDPDRIFKPGEFAKYIEKALNTVDLIFTDGIDWKAFFASFQTLQDEYGAENIGIQAIERKSGSAFVVRIEVPPEANKPEIESKVKQLYETKVKLEAQNDSLLRENANLNNIVNTLASRPIIVEAKAMASSESQGDTYNQSGTFGIGHMSGGEIKGNAKVAGEIHEVAPQTLAEVATEIEKLLDYFQHHDPSISQAQQMVKTATEEQPEILDAEIIEEAIKATPTLRQRIGAAGTAAYIETVKILLPPLGIAIEAAKAWNNPG